MEKFLVIDTNIWVYKTNLLLSASGAALLYQLQRREMKLALPEVIEEEIKRNSIKKINEKIDLINNSYSDLQILMGHRDDYEVPIASEIKSRIANRFRELEKILHRSEFTFQQAKRALSKVLDAVPPNGEKNQQFKDSAIWEAILDLSKIGSVDFVTEDKGFFQDGNPAKGLAVNLNREVQSEKYPIKIYYELKKYLESSKEDIPPIDKENIATKINDQLRKFLADQGESYGFSVRNIESSNVSLFLTEKVGLIAVEFELKLMVQNVFHPDLNAMVTAFFVVKGQAEYKMENESVSAVQIDEALMYDERGTMLQGYGTRFARMHAVVGGRQKVQYRMRSILDDE